MIRYNVSIFYSVEECAECFSLFPFMIPKMIGFDGFGCLLVDISSLSVSGQQATAPECGRSRTSYSEWCVVSGNPIRALERRPASSASGQPPPAMPAPEFECKLKMPLDQQTSGARSNEALCP